MAKTLSTPFVSEQSEPFSLERLTKPVILASAAAAVLTQTWMRRDFEPWLAGATGIAFVLASVGAYRWPVWTRRVTMSLAFLVPALFIAVRGEFDVSDWMIWVAAVLGLMLPTPAFLRWSLPLRWRLPLAHWGLVAATTWPIVMLRESDFDFGLIPSNFGATSAAAACIVMTGVLWFDWLHDRYRAGEDDVFRREILWPLSLGWCACAAVALWQTLKDISFLNPRLWSDLGRVSGSLADSNLFGVVSAMVAPMVVAMAVDDGRRGWWLALAVLPISWLGVWASGSRSSIPLVFIGVVSITWGLRRSRRFRGIAFLPAGAATAIAVLAGFVLLQSQSPVIGPLARFNADFNPRWNGDWPGVAVDKLLTRDGYGVITNAVIRETPVVGVGIGAFNPLVHLYAWRIFHRVLPPDNAQNWFRHQFAELGALGSAGWLTWVLMFGIFLFTARVDRERVSGIVTRSVMIAFGLISLVGAPGQSVVIALMFWTFAFWITGQAGQWRRTQDSGERAPTAMWIVVWALVVVYAAVMIYAGLTFLRPPLQALRAGLDYAAGFYPREDDSPYAWTQKRAVAVVPASGRWVTLELIVNHPDAYKNPVDVKVWVDGRLALSRSVTSSYPIAGSIELNSGADRTMIETWVSRVSRPSDFGSDDARLLGMAIGWTFTEHPPLFGSR